MRPWLVRVFSACQGCAALAGAGFFRLPGLCSPGWCAFLPFARVVWSWLVRVFSFARVMQPWLMRVFSFAKVMQPRLICIFVIGQGRVHFLTKLRCHHHFQRRSAFKTAPPSPFPAALRLFSTNDAADLCAHFAFLHHRGLFDPFFLSSLTEK